MGRTHIWRRYNGDRTAQSWCPARIQETAGADTPTVFDRPERSDCLFCLVALRDESLRVAACAARNAEALTERIESLRRKRRRAAPPQGEERGE